MENEQFIELEEMGKSYRKSLKLKIGDTILYFSFNTIIAFERDGELVVSENVWGQTTARHLNKVDGGKRHFRLDNNDFQKGLSELLEEMESLLSGELSKDEWIEFGEMNGWLNE